MQVSAPRNAGSGHSDDLIYRKVSQDGDEKNVLGWKSLKNFPLLRKYYIS
jgi:hypothetical protein